MSRAIQSFILTCHHPAGSTSHRVIPSRRNLRILIKTAGCYLRQHPNKYPFNIAVLTVILTIVLVVSLVVLTIVLIVSLVVLPVVLVVSLVVLPVILVVPAVLVVLIVIHNPFSFTHFLRLLFSFQGYAIQRMF